MSEQEYDGLTLEGLAQRVEALERGEAGKDQTGEETAAEFLRPASSGEQEYAGLTLQALARRLAVLERENVLLREQALAEPRSRSTFDRVRCYDLNSDFLSVYHGATVGSDRCWGLHVVTDPDQSGHWYIRSWPHTALTGFTVAPGARGVVGLGNVGVWGVGEKHSEDEDGDPTGVLGEGDEIGVEGRGGRVGVIGRSGEEIQLVPGNRHGVVGNGMDIGVWGDSRRGHLSGRGVGVQGIGHSAGVRGRWMRATGVPAGSSLLGYGGEFLTDDDQAAQLRLEPATSAGAPDATINAHKKGELYMDSEGALFVCTDDGTPGSWSRFTTTPA